MSERRRGLALRTAVALLGLTALPLCAQAQNLRGTVELDIERDLLANAGPIVVYLERDGGPPVRRTPSQFEIRQQDAHFSPAFLVVAQGDRVRMPNDDTIYHNVFSYSRPNAFDLGMYGRGESREVVFDHPGAVSLYCSIHESMSATVYVAPSRLYAVAGHDGQFEIKGVPPGHYKLRSWSRELPEAETSVDVAAGRPTEAHLVIASEDKP